MWVGRPGGLSAKVSIRSVFRSVTTSVSPSGLNWTSAGSAPSWLSRRTEPGSRARLPVPSSTYPEMLFGDPQREFIQSCGASNVEVLTADANVLELERHRV